MKGSFKGNISRVFAIAAAIAAISAPAAATVSSAAKTAPVDLIFTKRPETRPVMQLKASANANPYKHIRKGERNQRQYRKFLRQNPHRRHSKKAR